MTRRHFWLIAAGWMAGLMILAGPACRNAAVAGVIRGTVSESGTGAPGGDLRIRIYDEDWQMKFTASTWTQADGTYASGDLAAGNYYVRAVSTYPQPWVTQYW